MNELIVRASNGQSRIEFHGSLKHLPKAVRQILPGRRIGIVTDSNVSSIYLSEVRDVLAAENISSESFEVPAGEESKSFENVHKLLSFFLKIGLSRGDGVLALGGGVIGDLAGFAASIYKRGIPLIQAPTTLLSQVDSAVGGKTGVNLPEGKNLAGSFFQPALVFVSSDVLLTLPERELDGGCAEIIKYGAIRDETLFRALESDSADFKTRPDSLQIIRRCLEIKRDYVEADPLDLGVRMELNFGHTFGHAIEKLSGFGAFHHGEAVAVGMVMAARFGEWLGLTESGTELRISALLKRYGLPVSMPNFTQAELLNAILYDKKREGESISFVLLKRIGEAEITKISTSQIAEFMETFNGTN